MFAQNKRAQLFLGTAVYFNSKTTYDIFLNTDVSVGLNGHSDGCCMDRAGTAKVIESPHQKHI